MERQKQQRSGSQCGALQITLDFNSDHCGQLAIQAKVDGLGTALPKSMEVTMLAS